MPSKLIFSPRAAQRLFELENDRGKQGLLKQITKSLEFLKENPRHPSLRTHKYKEFSEYYGKEIFEAYVQQYTPGAYRIFFYYSGKSEITIIAITPHP